MAGYALHKFNALRGGFTWGVFCLHIVHYNHVMPWIIPYIYKKEACIPMRLGCNFQIMLIPECTKVGTGCQCNVRKTDSNVEQVKFWQKMKIG